MRYVIGVDGGPGGITAVLVDSCGNLLGAGLGGAATLDRDGGGAERLRRSISDAIIGAISMADLENARISAACLSMPGDPIQLETVCAPVCPADQVLVGLQTHIALNTVSLGAPGAVVLADFGAEAYGVNGHHESCSVGGWSQIQGDEGSAYWIGQRALNACCRMQDGVGPSTQLLNMLIKHLEADSVGHIYSRINTGNMSRLEVAGLLEVVELAAVQGDAIAKGLLRDAGKELGNLVSTILRRLDMCNGVVTVGAVGNVFRSGRMVLRAFRESVQKCAPECTILGPQAPSCVGAAIEALDEIGIEIQEQMSAALRISLPRLSSARLHYSA